MKFIFKKKHFEKKFNLMREQVEPERAADVQRDDTKVANVLRSQQKRRTRIIVVVNAFFVVANAFLSFHTFFPRQTFVCVLALR